MPIVKSVAENWYSAKPCGEDIFHVREKHIDRWAAGDIWMIRGSDRDLVFDTGTGIVPLSPFLDTLSNNPRVAVTCCHYYDHVGGLHGFEHRTCHPLESTFIESGTGLPETLIESEFSALPYEGFKPSDYTLKGTSPTQVVQDGETISLGNRKLKVLHTPGRTPGSIMLWEQATGFLFGGETAFIDPLDRDFIPEQSVELYEQSLRRLLGLPIRKVFGGHYGTFDPYQLVALIGRETGRYT